MTNYKTIALLPLCLVLVACGPMAVIGLVGSTVTNAAYNQAERDLNDPKTITDSKALDIAQTTMQLGIEYMRQGQYERALDNLRRALSVKPDYAPVYNVLGLLYQRLGEPTEAEKQFKQAIALDPSNATTYNNYGLFLCTNNRRGEALNVFLKAADNPLYKTPEIALTNAGLCQSDDPISAEIYFKKALTKNADFANALIEMAFITYSRNEYQTAYQHFERYRKNARQTPRSLLLGIQICQALGYQDAASSYALLLKNNYPDTQEAKILQQMAL